MIQRLYELWLNMHNEKILIEQYGANEVDPKDSLRMRLLHISWFASLTMEVSFNGQFLTGISCLIVIALLVFSQLIRMHTMKTLGNFWTIKVYQIPNSPVIHSGIYKTLLHPNYFVVILEIALVPLLLNAWITMIVFSILNLIFIYRRIKLEESELLKNPIYIKMKKENYIFIPYIF